MTMIGFWMAYPLRVFSDWNVAAFSAATETEALKELFPELKHVMPSDMITIEVHDLVENGAIVPVKIKTNLPEVSSITIVVEKNPNPLIANFNMTPECAGFVATRIKVGESSMIGAVVKSQEKFFSAKKMVEVTEGGCG